MALYDKYDRLIIPASTAKLRITSSLPGSRKQVAVGGPGNEGIDLAIWIQEKIDNETIILNLPDLAALIALTGLPAGTTNLGLFSGSIISDNTTIVNAFQELETYISTLGTGDSLGTGFTAGGGSGTIPAGTQAVQAGSFEIDTTGQSGYTLKLGGVTGAASNRYGVSIAHNQVYLGNTFGTQTQGYMVLNSSGVSMGGSPANTLTLASGGGGQLVFTSDFTIFDNNNLGGIKYLADYSANYTDRSLVDKEYVDNLAFPTLNIGSGLIGDGSIGDPLDWAGAFTSSPCTGSGTAFFPITIQNNSITSTHIQNGTILFEDWNQNSATLNQVPSWDGGQWVAVDVVDLLTMVVDGSGAANQVAYWSDPNTLTGNALFKTNGTSMSLNRATSAPSTILTTKGTTTGASGWGYTHYNSSDVITLAIADNGQIAVGAASGNPLYINDISIERAIGFYMATSSGNIRLSPFGIVHLDSPVGINTSTVGSNQLRVDGSIRFDLGSDDEGDLFYRDSSGNFVRLPIGNDTEVLTVASGLPSWEVAATGLPGGASAGDFAIYDGADWVKATPVKDKQTGITGTDVTLPSTPLANTIVDVYLNGGLQDEGVDYTISGAGITFLLTTLIASDVIITKYFS